MVNPQGSWKPGPGAGERQTSEVFNPLLNVSDVVQYPGGIVIPDDVEDSGHTDKEDVLRAGMALVRIETGADKGKFVSVDHSDAPDPEDVEEAVILLETVPMALGGEAVEQVGVEAMIAGTVNLAKIWIVDSDYTDAIRAALPRVSFLSTPA